MSHPERGDRRPDYRAFLAAYDRAWRRFRAEPTAHHDALLRVGPERDDDAAARGVLRLGQHHAT